MRPRHIRGIFILFMLAAAAPLCALGVTSQLAGRALDHQGVAIPGATVAIRNMDGVRIALCRHGSLFSCRMAKPLGAA